MKNWGLTTNSTKRKPLHDFFQRAALNKQAFPFGVSNGNGLTYCRLNWGIPEVQGWLIAELFLAMLIMRLNKPQAHTFHEPPIACPSPGTQ